MGNLEKMEYKYNILSFNQTLLWELNIILQNIEIELSLKNKITIDLFDLHLLQGFLDFQTSGKMSTIINEESKEEFKWVNYKSFAEEFPFLGLNKRIVSERFKKLSNLTLLKHYHHKVGGSYSCYKPNEEILQLFHIDNNQTKENRQKNIEKLKELIIPPIRKNVYPLYEKTYTPYTKKRIAKDPYTKKTLLLNNKSIINNTITDSKKSVKSKEYTLDDIKKKYKIDDKFINNLRLILEKGNFQNLITNKKGYVTKTLMKIIEYILSFSRNDYSKMEFDQVWQNKNNIKFPTCSNKTVFKFIERAVKRYNLMKKDGYWPHSKSSLTRNLLDFLFNVRTRKSWFLFCLSNCPEKLSNYIAEKMEEKAPNHVKEIVGKNNIFENITGENEKNLAWSRLIKINKWYEEKKEYYNKKDWQNWKINANTFESFFNKYIEFMKDTKRFDCFGLDFERNFDYFSDWVKRNHGLILKYDKRAS